ncbi:hypothetical protein RYX36_034744 [Vicia faba]
MSTPILLQPPPLEVTQEAYTTHSGHGSMGPVIAVLAVITVLGIIAGMIGRLCSGGRVMGYGEYDIESWIQTKCSSCVGSRVAPPPPPPVNEPDAIQDSQEIKEDQPSQQESRQSSLGHNSS